MIKSPNLDLVLILGEGEDGEEYEEPHLDLKCKPENPSLLHPMSSSLISNPCAHVDEGSSLMGARRPRK
jgi:hypothetical protein